MSNWISERGIEARTTPYAVEMRSAGAGSRRIGGYAAVYNKKRRPMGAFVEVVEKRAFSKLAGDHFAGVVCRF